MLKNYMHKRERYFAMLNDNRVVHPFAWGMEFVDANVNGIDPREFFAANSKNAIANSEQLFSVSNISDLKFEISNDGVLKWQSSIETPSVENNTAIFRYFKAENSKRAVIVLPHWNAKEGTYFDLCKIFTKVGMSALRLTLPYHEVRMPPELERAEYLVYPNVGRTLQSVRQAVLDTRAAVHWLKQHGYEQIGIVGTSIGSCTAFLAFVHDLDIDAGVFNHVSGYFSDVVWNGLSTYHVRIARKSRHARRITQILAADLTDGLHGQTRDPNTSSAALYLYKIRSHVPVRPVTRHNARTSRT
ncbi:MAG TPA: hypothetical protein PKA82_01170 [Pyrinomonadaceae bacterium]|nr:hypothetical protein [Pyrinomonadaceae bacterium]